jgi:hypothetical protein
VTYPVLLKMVLCECAGRSVVDSRLENCKLSKDVPPPKPLRDVNQILSILQKRNATETCSDNNMQTSVLLTKVPPESETSKRHKMESISTKGNSGISTFLTCKA